MRVEESVEINRPVEEVFSYVANPQSLPEWSGIVQEVCKEAWRFWGSVRHSGPATVRFEGRGGREQGVDGLVKGLVWVGTRTERYGEMVGFYRDTLGLALEHEEGEFALFRLPDGAKAEVFGPSDTEHVHFSTGPVAGFLVDDVRDAREVLEARGVEFVGSVHEWEPTGEAWSHFRAPDGNVYEITHRPKQP